jgi:hypothetical protein
VKPNLIAIDTMPRDTGKLTAVELSGPEPVFYYQPALGMGMSALDCAAYP